MELIPILATIEGNKHFADHPDCQDSLYFTIDFYKKVGYNPPWIGYYAVDEEGQIVAMAAFKGKSLNNQIEIAYGTIERFQQKGIGTQVCRLLVNKALETDPSVLITARTLPEKNFSTRILEKNNFHFKGIVDDPEDGEVWEWVYSK